MSKQTMTVLVFLQTQGLVTVKIVVMENKRYVLIRIT